LQLNYFEMRMHKIVIVDYGMGNTNSVKKQVEKTTESVIISRKKEDILSATKLILPGVGHFKSAMDNLKSYDLIDTLNIAVLEQKKPILGICLGMQLMTTYSEEGNLKGLSWIDGTIKKFDFEDKANFKRPHMGWNQTKHHKQSALLKDINENSEYYFVHSFYMVSNDSADVLCSTKYELEFTSAFEKNNIFGVQFHPEKSHSSGKQMIKNFIQL
jgi:glutamine amidotransferase